jgi:hypothetical protein
LINYIKSRFLIDSKHVSDNFYNQSKEIKYLYETRINSTYACDRLRSDVDGLTTCHICSIPHSSVIMVKRGRFGEVLEMPLLPFRNKAICMYVLYETNGNFEFGSKLKDLKCFIVI